MQNISLMQILSSPIFEFVIEAFLMIICSLISYKASTANSKKDIEKAILSRLHTEKDLFNNAFSELISAANYFCQIRNIKSQNDAVRANAEFLTVAPKCFHPIIEEMATALVNQDFKAIQSVNKNLLSLYSEYIENSN